MTRISPRHPRYASLRTRARLAEACRAGIVAPEGLIAHGRGEAFDYLLGERTTASAREAIRRTAAGIRAARHPVLSVNGNVAALAAAPIAALVRAYPALRVEVNLFHRTPARARAIAAVLRAAGVPRVLGVRPTARLRGLPSDRARIDREGIGRADLVIIPLEDGDRAEALRRSGRRVVAIDLNPLSRTARTAHLTIVDELTRCLGALTEELARGAAPGGRRPPERPAREYLAAALREMRRRLPPEPPPARRGRAAPGRAGGRPR